MGSGEEGEGEGDHQLRRRRRGILRMYYGVDDEEGVAKSEGNPVDIDGVTFKSKVFLDKLLKESRLEELYLQEERMKKGGCGSNESPTHIGIIVLGMGDTCAPGSQFWRTRFSYLLFSLCSFFSALQRFRSSTVACSILSTRTTPSSSKPLRPSEK